MACTPIEQKQVTLLANSPGQTCSAQASMQASGVGGADCTKEIVLARTHMIMNWRVFMFEIRRREKTIVRTEGLPTNTHVIYVFRSLIFF